MAQSRLDAHRERGQLIEIDTLPRRRVDATHPRRVRRTGAGLVAPAWKVRAQATEPLHMEPATDGALALLEQGEAETLPLPRRAPARRRVLIVEDDAQMARLVAEALRLEGEPDWDVQVASEGAAALEQAGATPPDVVLLDVLLPGLDGAEVYRRLRADPKTRAARVLFVTAGTSFDLARRGIEDGLLLRKPFDVHTLAGLVRALLDG